MLTHKLVTGLMLLSAASAVMATPTGFYAPSTNIHVPGRGHTNILISDTIRPNLVNPFALPGTETPASLKAVYNISSSLKGGNAIAVVDAYDDPKALNDFNYYSSTGGFPKETSTNVTSSSNKVFQVVYASGSKPPVDPTGVDHWDLEESLDFEIAHAMAPSAKIYLVEAASFGLGDLLNAVAVAEGLPGVRQVSMSWGAGDNFLTEIFNSYFQTNGQVCFASSGDGGAGVEWPAVAPYVVGVGGTTINRVAGKFSSETAWSLAGGGQSTGVAKPTYQNVVSSLTMRGVPDIAADADPASGVGVYDSNNPAKPWLQVGGTSLACPIIAGLANLSGKNRANGFSENNTIYANLGKSALRDITQGSNGNPAKAGYDLVTGCGVPNGLGAL